MTNAALSSAHARPEQAGRDDKILIVAGLGQEQEGPAPPQQCPQLVSRRPKPP